MIQHQVTHVGIREEQGQASIVQLAGRQALRHLHMLHPVGKLPPGQQEPLILGSTRGLDPPEEVLGVLGFDAKEPKTFLNKRSLQDAP